MKNQVLQIANEVAKFLNLDVYDILYIFDKESSLNLNAINPVTKAKGLIQIMPKNITAYEKKLGEKFTFENQLPFILEHFRPYKSKIKNISDLYFSVFFPVAIGKPDDFVLKSTDLSASLIANQNKAMDINNDSQLTVAEVKNWLLGSKKKILIRLNLIIKK
jgi:hypothetical protein